MAVLLDEEEGAEGEGIDAGAVETADGASRVGDERFAEEVEGGVDENGGGRGFAEFVEELPEEGIGVAFDGVDANRVAVESETLETSDRARERGKRGHGKAVGGGVEEFGGAFSGDGQGERMKFLAVFNELIDVFDDVFGKGRSEEAAIAQGAMAEFGASLAPGDNFIAVEKRGGFLDKLLLAREIAISNFAVVENGLDFLRIRGDADGETGERAATRMTSDFLAGEVGGAESGARVAGDGLDIDVIKGGAVLQRTD